MATQISALTDEQSTIVKLSEGQHLVLAPPGTGKTELLAHRVDQALSNGVAADKMICLTFTNRAAKGMRERVEEKHPNSKVFIGNIHQYCSAFLYRNKLISQFSSLIDEDDTVLLIEEAKSMVYYQDKTFIGDLQKLNTYIKQQQLGFPDNVMVFPPGGIQHNSQAVEVCKKYEKLKQESCLFDFDDLLTNAYLYLFKGAERYALTSYEWIQVDEVQDLNPIQWGIISRIAAQDAHKVYFGDYEQAIFSFMGARLENLHKIRGEFDKVHNLQKNFRSPSYLLNVQIDYAKALLNPTWKKDPIPKEEVKPQEGYLQLINVNGTNTDEAVYIIDKIIPAIPSSSTDQTAILVKWNSTADLWSKLLAGRSINHFKISGYDLFSRKLIKDIIAFLSCLENEFDRISWFRLFNIFGKIQTLTESRHFVNTIYTAGFFPTDFIGSKSFEKTEIQNFIEDFKDTRVVVFDTETTGLDTDVDDIIQIAAIELVNGQKGRTFEVYLTTDKSLEETISIHNITKELLDEKGFPRKETFESFLAFINNDILAAHNLDFDLSILKKNIIKEEIASSVEPKATYDTLQLSRRIFPTLNSYKLIDLLDQLNIEGENTHNALDDVKATANLICRLYTESVKLESSQADFLITNQKILERFGKNISPLWESLFSFANQEIGFTDIITQFLAYIREKLSYSVKSDDLHQLNKLTKHMDTCEKLDIIGLLQTHMSNYRHYKEADLITGDEKIIISTVYKAKGLEFSTVIIPECVENIYPSFSSDTEDQIAEDARALYVALSRAKMRLILSTHTASVNQYGRCFPRRKSRFIECIGKHFNSINVY